MKCCDLIKYIYFDLSCLDRVVLIDIQSMHIIKAIHYSSFSKEHLIGYVSPVDGRQLTKLRKNLN